MSWKNFLVTMNDITHFPLDSLRRSASENWREYQVYPCSIHVKEDSLLFLVKEQTDKKLIIVHDSILWQSFEGAAADELNLKIKICPLTPLNATMLRKYFSFTAPISLQSCPITIGLGDRLGLANPGHLHFMKRYPNVRPVLAQQSMRELHLTGRTYQQILDAASWAVFQEDYQLGFGADGDHLKTAAEIKTALDCGFTMITLDCSEKIDNSIPLLSDDEVQLKYELLPRDLRSYYNRKYLNNPFQIDDLVIQFTVADLQRTVLIYYQAIEHIIHIYQNTLEKAGRPIDFEVSIDETLTATSPPSHFFVANELRAARVKALSLAPRFCGEFQKGIDYVGDLSRFGMELRQHHQIARYFGYKISIHSGSDKFTIFPMLHCATEGRYHLKTAGTSWLEALRVIAKRDPGLFREFYAFALEHLNAARKYYSISADPDHVPPLSGFADGELAPLLDHHDARQILHITYGLILQARENGIYLFRDRIKQILHQYENDYYLALESHFQRHAKRLGLSATVEKLSPGQSA